MFAFILYSVPSSAQGEEGLKLFLDMDGVLADFVTGACLAHNRPSPYLDPEALGIFDMEKLWGISVNEFWRTIDAKVDFWDTLQKTPEADALVAAALSMFSIDNIAVLTAPSMDPTCVPGKRRWMQKHYPQLAKRMIFASAGAKQFLAGPSYILSDDRDKNISQFKLAGGVGILMPRLWNAGYGRAHHSLDDTLDILLEVTNNAE